MKYFLIVGINRGLFLAFVLFYESITRKNHAWFGATNTPHCSVEKRFFDLLDAIEYP